MYTVKPLLSGHLWDLNRGVRLIGVGTVGGVHGVTSFFIDLVWFYCKTINTALFDLNKSSSNWLKNKFKKEMFDVYTELEKNCSYWDQLLPYSS